MLWDCIFRLLLAGVLGGVIGWDREYRAKEAGLRTHFLVALGSALIMIVSQYGFADVLAKPGMVWIRVEWLLRWSVVSVLSEQGLF